MLLVVKMSSDSEYVKVFNGDSQYDLLHRRPAGSFAMLGDGQGETGHGRNFSHTAGFPMGR